MVVWGGGGGRGDGGKPGETEEWGVIWVTACADDWRQTNESVYEYTITYLAFPAPVTKVTTLCAIDSIQFWVSSRNFIFYLGAFMSKDAWKHGVCDTYFTPRNAIHHL